MKKEFFPILIIFTLLLIIPCAFALKIEHKSFDETLIKELGDPAIIELKVTNIGNSGTFVFDNIPGFFVMETKNVFLRTDIPETIQLRVYAKSDIDYKKYYYTLQYNIKGPNNFSQSEELTIKVIELKSALEVWGSDIDPESSLTKIYIKNKENFNFIKIKAEFLSPFFKIKEEFGLNAKEQKEFEVKLNQEDFKSVSAGYYTINTKIETEGEKADVEGKIKFKEKELVISEKKDYGFLIITNVISKKNEGNVAVPSDTTIKKNIITRLFTTFEPEPDVIEREGMKVIYSWNRNVNPGETLNIIIKTNWIFPFVLIILIVAIVIFVKQSSGADLVVRKKVSFVKTKGGEFALKVSLFANAKKRVERINIIDKMPPLVKLHESFGIQRPSRIDEKNRRIEWDIDKLEKGEVRVFSYIVYSKLGVLGKFALPSARILYEVDGKIKEISSNMAFFVSEQRRGDIGEY